MLLVRFGGVSRINFADIVKKQTDRILRQQRLNGTAEKTITGNPAGDPVVTDPTAALEAHKAADDHTGYLTGTRHDALDHTGLTGIPAAEAFTEAVHALTDHTGLTGCGGAESFTDLDDAPADYAGQAGKVLAVNSTEDALEFVAQVAGASGSFDFGLITDTTTTSQDWGSLT